MYMYRHTHECTKNKHGKARSLELTSRSRNKENRSHVMLKWILKLKNKC